MRICITGGPRTGKTTFAAKLFEEQRCTCKAPPSFIDGRTYGMHATDCDDWLPEDIRLRHTDDVMQMGWSEASQHIADHWLTQPGPWIIEGVAVSRALRKWRDQHPGERPPVDRVIYLTETFEEPTAGQRTMAKGVETVHREIEGWLAQHGVRTEFLKLRELRCEHPGHNGRATL